MKMPLTGSLSEFPLPEVLLLIGSRTGRLRLFDAPEFIPMELDVSEGKAHGLHVGECFLATRSRIIAELGFAMEIGEGSFEFTPGPIVYLNQPLPVSELVLQLALHADEKLARHSAILGPELFYILETPLPDTKLSPEQNLFLTQSSQLLAGGVRAEDLAQYIGLDTEMVKLHLYDLHQFGIVRLVETTDVETLRQMMLQEEVSQMSNDFFLSYETTEKLRDSGRLLHSPLAR